MRLIIFLSFFLFCFSSSFAQNFTLTQFIDLRSKSLADVDMTLSNNNWTCLFEASETDNNLGFTYYVFLKSKFTDRGQAFLNYFFSNESDLKRLEIQVFQTKIYSNYIAELQKLGCRLIKKEAVEEEIIEYYQNESTTIRVKTIADKDCDVTDIWYTFFIMTNQDYNTTFSNK